MALLICEAPRRLRFNFRGSFRGVCGLEQSRGVAEFVGLPLPFVSHGDRVAAGPDDAGSQGLDCYER